MLENLANLKDIRILAVEDDPTIRLLVRKALEHHGALIDEAETAKDGKTKAFTLELDLITLLIQISCEPIKHLKRT